MFLSFTPNLLYLFSIGTNIHLIPVNKPITPIVSPTERDGSMMTGDNMGSAPNYFPNSFQNVRDDPAHNNELPTHLPTSDVTRFESGEEDNYTQVRNLYLSFDKDQRERLHSNIVSELQYCYEFIQQRALDHFEKIHPEYAAGVKRALQRALKN